MWTFSEMMQIGGRQMDINLEKIELVKDRTGATYAEAKEALEAADGSVVDAIIAIEEKINKEYEDVKGESLKDSPIFAKMKEIVEKGNVTKIVIKKGDKKVVTFPVTAGVVGAVLVPWGVVLGVVAALGAQCDIEFNDVDGNVIDIDGKVVSAANKAKDAALGAIDKAQDVFNKADKQGETMEKIGDYASKTTDTIQEYVQKGLAAFNDTVDKINENGALDDIKSSVEAAAKKAAEAVKDAAKEASSKASDAKGDLEKDMDEAMEDEFKDEEI